MICVEEEPAMTIATGVGLSEAKQLQNETTDHNETEMSDKTTLRWYHRKWTILMIVILLIAVCGGYAMYFKLFANSSYTVCFLNKI